MAPPKEESESTRELPRPELNPLVNPLLGENMGKWAEVYFTSPPEKREEAVLELIRELKAEESQPDASLKSDIPVARSMHRIPDTAVAAPDFSSRNNYQMFGHCPACGHDNPATHQFCGMCGEKISSEDAAVGLADVSGGTAQSRESNSLSSDIFGGAARTTKLDDEVAPTRYERSPDEDEADELARLRRISDGSSSDRDTLTWYQDPPSSRRKWYAGAGLAIAAVTLAYMNWRGSQPSQTAHRPANPTVATAEPSPAPETAANANVPAATPPQTQSAAPPNVATAHENKGRESGTVEAVSDKKTATEVQPASLGNGQEELTIAQRYLNGGTGLQRNSAEGAQWLWKSVAKHNSAATLLLADLYLKGDGVSKNCDQARVLLDSAARKGVAGAGERLRNLQAFGCQ